MDAEVRYGGFWIRLAATILDSIWLYGIIYAVLWMILGPGIFSAEASYTATQFVFEYIIPLIVVMVLWMKFASTPGKMILKMKIVDAKTLGPVSAGRLLLRYFAYFVALIPLGLGFLWVAWDKRKQGWHDKIARTVVVRGL